jgi:type I restriction enzyme, S subunit
MTEIQIKQGWKDVRLGKVMDDSKTQIQRGETYDSVPMELVQPGKKYVTNFERKVFTGSGTKFRDGDTIFARITPCLQNKKIAKVKGLAGGVGFGSTEYFIFRAKSGVSNPDYIYYLTTEDSIVQPAIKSMVGASGRQRANESVVRNLQITLPPLPIQDKIAEVLSNYDDLIEGNNRRIQILESMAAKIYTEWFVHYRYPGSENVPLVDSGGEYGEIPLGWEVRKLGDIADLVMGQSPKSEYYNSEQVGLPFHQGVADFQEIYPKDRIFSTSGNRFANKGDLLFSVRAPVGKMNLANKKIILGRGLASIRHKLDFQSVLISMFLNKFTEKDMIGNGAIYKSVNKNEIESLEFIYPPVELQKKLEVILQEYFNEKAMLSEINQNLKKSRDLLIPQLVGGLLEV